MKDETKAFYSLIFAALLVSGFTAGVKYLVAQGVPALSIAWARFFCGFLVFSAYGIYQQKRWWPRPQRARPVLLRAITNFVAVGLFYLAIAETSLYKANLLNMSYPLFIAVMAPIFLQEATSGRQFLALAISFLGVMSMYQASWAEFGRGDVFGLLCGFMAAVSLLALRSARSSESSTTIVFYVMAVGCFGLAPFLDLSILLSLSIPDFLVLLASSVGGLSGQFFLTYSYRYMTAMTGALTGMIRLVFSATVGWVFFAEALSPAAVSGSLLVLLGISLLRSNKNTIAPKPS